VARGWGMGVGSKGFGGRARVEGSACGVEGLGFECLGGRGEGMGFRVWGC